MDYISINEAKDILDVSRQSVYQAIILKKLKTTRDKRGRHRVKRSELDRYIAQKYSRDHSMYEGTLKFDKEKGEYSATQAASYLRLTTAMFYSYLRKKKIPFTRKGAAYVLQKSDLDAFKEKVLIIRPKKSTLRRMTPSQGDSR